jgi:hypothetical protein
MAGGTKIGDLFMALSLNPDLKSWDLGKAVIDQTVSRVKALAVESQMAKVDVRKLGEQMGLVARQSPWERLSKGGEGFTSSLWHMVAAAAAFVGVMKIEEMVKSTVDFGSKLNDTSQKTGLSAEALQKWGYAAKLNSSDMDTFAKGVTILAKNLEVLGQKGEGPAADGLKALGISLDDPAVKGKNLEGVLNLISNAASKMPDGEKKIVGFRDLLGKMGVDLIPTFNNGIAGMAGYSAELERLGAVIDKDSVARLDDLGDNIDRVKVAFEGLKNQAVIALLPYLEQLMKDFQDWIASNKELIKTTIQTVVEDLVDIVSTLASVVAFAVRHWKIFASILGGVLVVGAIMKVIKTIMFFQTVLETAAAEAVIDWLLILGPIALIAAAIVGIGLLIYEFRDEVWAALQAVGGFFKELGLAFVRVMSGVWDSFTTTLSELWDYMKKGFKAAWEFIADLPVIKQMIELVGAVRGLMGSQSKDLDARAAAGATTDELYGIDGVPLWQPSGAGANGPTAVTSPSGGAPPATAPSRAGGGSPVSVSNSYTVQIDAKNANAHEVGQIVDDKLREHDERTRRDTAAALGVGGFQ